ncbi:hypothetical protein HMPREF9582_02532 [Cutibacterium acnes HL060PA1]|nr:hypothetical protein HMPREF9603_01719 [Cutibacterium acnes HL001PA1]EFT10361.1 hypothetical protein HMPREF9619_01147 [Cutibacterium acnes HL082PA2]EFT24882.1 hypothetical protein HMPREF9577_02502 [Cutibacterium acnes HL110PA3]EFT62215.1 hypothetical protein HMPREF9578_02577 [Cutibacterium acnes HL110PA4]EFT65402.1 hypothetical protein HMPREF9582_02532 [Cutibacterium acnes HL060PA1]EGE68824.1 hypothetical protein HMPREF9341_02119 [Cutibacterium acnes HL103PA1]
MDRSRHRRDASAGLRPGPCNEPNYQWPVVWLYLGDVKIITDISYTILLTFATMLLGTAVALLMAMMKQPRNPVLRGVSRAYIFVFREAPVYTRVLGSTRSVISHPPHRGALRRSTIRQHRDRTSRHNASNHHHRSRPQRKRLPDRNHPLRFRVRRRRPD